MIRDKVTPLYLFDKKYRISIPNREDWHDGPALLPRDAIVWYTDGSKGRIGAGAGVYQEAVGVALAYSLGTITTVLQSEMVAILYGASEALECCQDRNIYIASDSKAAICALKRYVTTSQLVGECHEALNRLAGINRVTLIWVPGHCGIKGNNVADELAKEGARKRFIGPEPIVGVSNKCLTLELKQWRTLEHQKEWRAVAGCRQAKALIGENLNPKRAADFRRLNRKEAKVITGLLTGHGDLRYHRHKMGIVEDPKCRKCGEENETSAHILCRCPALVRERYQITGCYFLEETAIATKELAAVLFLWKGLWA